MRILLKPPVCSGLLCGLFISIAGCGNPLPQNLVSLTIKATPATVTAGGAAVLKATLHLADGTTQDVTAGTQWTSSNSALATMTSGALAAKAAGTVTVQAAYVDAAPAGSSPASATTAPQNLAASTQVTITSANGPGALNVPMVTWNTPQAISYGTALSTTQLNATANVPGTFAYAPAAGTVFKAGTQMLSVTFTPADSNTYTAAVASVPLIVTQDAPIITWPTPAAITKGAALSSAQLDATATVPGRFSYTPAAGTVPQAGTLQLTAAFSPSDTIDYVPVTAHNSITVDGPTAGPGTAAALSAFYCSTDNPPKGAGTDTCTVKLASGSSSGATSVSLTSSNAAVTVPATATVQADATAAEFTAKISSISTAQTVTLTASTGGSSIRVALQLSAATSATGGTFSYSGSPLVTTLAPSTPSKAISNDFFGMTVYHLAPNSLYSQPNMTPFPPFPVSTLRLWDVTYWALIDTYDGQNNWTEMDNTISIAQKNGVSDFIFTFGRVPAWASTNPTDTCTGAAGLTPGSCAPPNMSALKGFATQLVQRYCGKVKYYETWNEPDSPEFWDGTNAQLLAIAQSVYQIVKDPANCGCTNGKCSPNGGANPNQVLSPPIGGIAPSNLEWLDSYLAIANSPYPYADIAAFHGYVWNGYPMEDIVPGVQLLRQTLTKYGLSNLPLWNTEASWELNTNMDQDLQASWVMRYHALQAALGIPRFVWYAYDNCTWGTLWSSPLCTDNQGPTGQLTEAGNAYSTIETWLTGANLTHCQQYKNGLWACELQRAGNYDAWMLWSSTGANIPVPIPASFGLKVYRNWQNNVTTVPAQITVGQMPVLLENNDL
jgi:hypothetical protein